jgi:CheY-like chemotaxis protein
MEIDCILLVEDNEDDVLLFQASLEDADILNPVHVVGSAENAISYLAGTGDYADRSLYPLPRVVFVDLHLPGKSGHDILEWMLREPELRDVLKVVLTGSKDPRHYTRALELGANAYLEKPVTKEQLIGPCRNLRMVLAGGNRPGRD